MFPVFEPVVTAVTENELGGTATTIGVGIATPKTMLVEVLPAVGNTATPAEVGAIVTATGKLFVFSKPA
jgi:hypothetical protein